ncbi:MAG: cell division protein FtsQ/DivIB [Chlamydiales bacterium]
MHETHAVEVVVQPSGLLPTYAIAELLGLSVDQPISFRHFPLKEAKNRLLDNGIFDEVHLKKIRPNILFVKYSLKKPIALVGDTTNLAVDQEGSLFPFSPFYSAEKLPTVFFGRKIPSAVQIEIFTKLIQKPQVERLDLSRVDVPSLGRRGVIVTTIEKQLLRLTPKEYEKEWTHFEAMKKALPKNSLISTIIDLRIPNVAYVEERK